MLALTMQNLPGRCVLLALLPVVAAETVAAQTSIHWFRGKPPKRFRLADRAVFDLREDGFPNFSNSDFALADGWLYIEPGYAWDGASGPAIDTPSFMRASLVHDVLYQAMREGLMARSHRAQADKVLLRYCKADGMNWLRRKYVYRIVRWLGPPAEWLHVGLILAVLKSPVLGGKRRQAVLIFPSSDDVPTQALIRAARSHSHAD